MDILVLEIFVVHLKFRFNRAPCFHLATLFLSEYVFFCVFLLYIGMFVRRDLAGER